MKHILSFVFFALCLFSQVQASDTETLNSLKAYLSERKVNIDSKINRFCIRHKYIYKPEEKYWLYQGKSEAFDEIITYVSLFEKHSSTKQEDFPVPAFDYFPIPEENNSKLFTSDDGRVWLIIHDHMYQIKSMIHSWACTCDLPD